MSAAIMQPVASESVVMRGPARKAFKPKGRYGPTGLAIMAAAHILLGYALANGLGSKAVELIKKPLEATIIQEVKLPPPPPPPPPKPEIKKVKDIPKEAPPPPAYVPPPDVPAPAAPTAPVITAVQSEAPAPSPPPPVPPPPAPPPAPVAPARADIALACPKQTPPVIPDKAIDDGIEGTVRAEARIRGGKVVDVRIVSGPRVFHAAVRTAMMGYQCSSSDAEMVATQDFTFKIN